MDWQKPTTSEVWQAVEVYLSKAYSNGDPSLTVKGRVEALHACDKNSLYECPVLERDSKETPSKFAIRLGNRFYPHMKLMIEPTPDGNGHLYRADTHDKHIRPAPGSKEYNAFRELMENNQKLSEAIEAAWDAAGLPTFRRYLRQDLERRAAAAGSTTH